MTEQDDPGAPAPAKEPSGAARQFGGFAPALACVTDGQYNTAAAAAQAS